MTPESKILKALFDTIPVVFEDETEDKERGWMGITERAKARQDDETDHDKGK